MARLSHNNYALVKRVCKLNTYVYSYFHLPLEFKQTKPTHKKQAIIIVDETYEL